jgi:hypothetical protein
MFDRAEAFWDECHSSIIAAPVRAQRLGLRDYMLVLDELAAQRARSFYGAPALGGTCHTDAAIERWYKRLPRVLSGLSFEIKTIAAPEGPIP